MAKRYFPLPQSCACALDLAQTPALICRNEIRAVGAENVAMRLDSPSEPQIRSLGEKRASLSIVLVIFIVLAGVIALVAILIAYGLIGSH